jgi:hypothetical protein
MPRQARIDAPGAVHHIMARGIEKRKIFFDPLLCPKCLGSMKVISFIEDDALIKKILIHLGLWETRNHDPPKSNDTHIPTIETELTYDYTYSQLPPIDYWTQ